MASTWKSVQFVQDILTGSAFSHDVINCNVYNHQANEKREKENLIQHRALKTKEWNKILYVTEINCYILLCSTSWTLNTFTTCMCHMGMSYFSSSYSDFLPNSKLFQNILSASLCWCLKTNLILKPFALCKRKKNNLVLFPVIEYKAVS